jgi:hypothetical protein
LHLQLIPVAIIRSAAKTEPALAAMTEVLYPSPNDSVSAVDGVLNGRQLLTLRKPGEKSKCLDGIALTGRICANKDRERPQR